MQTRFTERRRLQIQHIWIEQEGQRPYIAGDIIMRDPARHQEKKAGCHHIADHRGETARQP